MSDFLALPSRQPKIWRTGIAGLDELIGGGFSAGQVWVITGAPASGKSTLLNQFVYALGVRHGLVVDYFGSRSDHPDLTRARLLSLALCRPPTPGSLKVEPRDDHRALAEVEALRSSQISVSTGGGFVIEALGDFGPDRQCLAIDDPEGKRPPVLDKSARHELRASADRGDLVLVTVPRSLCLQRVPAPPDGTPSPVMPVRERLREEWAAIADLVVEIAPTNVGESSMRLWQNRWGPRGHVELFYQPHRCRFVDSDGGSDAGPLPGVPRQDVEKA